MSTQPVVFDDNTVAQVPPEKLHDALTTGGGKLAQHMSFDDGSRAWVPIDKVHDAVTKGGGQLVPPDVPKPNVQMEGSPVLGAAGAAVQPVTNALPVIGGIVGGIAGAAGGPAGAIAGGAIGGGAGEAAKQLANRSMGGQPVPATSMEAARSIAREGGEMGAAAAAGEGAGALVKTAMPARLFAQGSAALERASQVAGKLPVDATPAGDQALKMKELAGRGGRLPKVVNDFLKRVTDPTQPSLTYDEARDFYSAATRLTRPEAQSMTPRMLKETGTFAKLLEGNISKTADAAGVLEDYTEGMNAYRNAGKALIRKQAAAKITKYVVEKGTTAAGAGAGVEAFHALFGDKK